MPTRRRRNSSWSETWSAIAGRRVAYWQLLSEPERERLGDLAAQLIATKRWEAARGFALDDDVVVTIAVQACLLVLGLDLDYFTKVTSIIVHPSTFSIPGPRTTAVQ